MRRLFPAGLVGWAAVLLVLFVVLWTVPPSLGSGRLLSLATAAVIIAIAAYSFDFLFAYMGLPSLLQGSLLGVGAYTTGLAITRASMNFWVTLPLAALFGLVVAAAIGIAAVRARGAYFAILTYGASAAIVTAATNLTALTNGSLGLVVFFDAPPLGPVHLVGSKGTYYLALIMLAFCMAALLWVRRSTFGRILLAAKDSSQLAASLGINPVPYRLLAMALAGAVAGLAGPILLMHQRAIEPSQFDVLFSFQLLIAVLIGGTGTVLGPAVGTIILVFLPEVLGLSPLAAQVANSVLLLVFITTMRRGIVGSIGATARRLINQRRSKGPQLAGR
jgi:branched-chain amino acid transport system permease protein